VLVWALSGDASRSTTSSRAFMISPIVLAAGQPALLYPVPKSASASAVPSACLRRPSTALHRNRPSVGIDSIPVQFNQPQADAGRNANQR